MSDHKRRLITFDTHFLGTKNPLWTAEEIGAAFLLLIERPNGHGPLEPAECARVVGVTRQRWKRIAANVEEILAEMIRVSVVKSQYGRIPISKETRAIVLERDGERCVYCGNTSPPFHFDHRTPLAKGGSGRPENIVVACAPCNLSKSDRSVEEWMRWR